jgi:hypothetical protein
MRGSGLKSKGRYSAPTIVSLNGEPLPTPNILENILQMPTPEVIKPSTKYGSSFTLRQGCAPITNTINQFLSNLNINDSSFEDNFNYQLPNFFKTTSEDVYHLLSHWIIQEKYSPYPLLIMICVTRRPR